MTPWFFFVNTENNYSFLNTQDISKYQNLKMTINNYDTYFFIFEAMNLDTPSEDICYKIAFNKAQTFSCYYVLCHFPMCLSPSSTL